MEKNKKDNFIVKSAKEWFPAGITNSLTNRVSFINGAEWMLEEIIEYSRKNPGIKDINEFIEKFKEKIYKGEEREN